MEADAVRSGGCMNAIQPVSECAQSRDIVPRSVSAALAAFEEMEREVASANTFQEIRTLMDFAKAAKILYPEVRQVREQADRARLGRISHRRGAEKDATLGWWPSCRK